MQKLAQISPAELNPVFCEEEVNIIKKGVAERKKQR